MYLQIVQTGEDALFRDAQAAGQDRELKALVRFQRIAEHIADEGDHLVVVARLEGFVQRDVILIDQDHHFAAVVFGKQGRQRAQTIRERIIRHIEGAGFHRYQRPIKFFFVHIQLVALQQKAKAAGFASNQAAHSRSCGLKGQAVYAFQAEEDHRELPLVLLAQLFFLCDFQAVEQGLVCANLKKALQHAHVQRLAEAAGAGKEVHLAPVLQKLGNKRRFINVVEVLR